MNGICECADHACPKHLGTDCSYWGTPGTEVLYRVDMDDATGTLFCDACAEDACESGLFTDAEVLTESEYAYSHSAADTASGRN